MRVQEPVAGPVARHHAQPTREVRDPEAVGRPARGAHAAGLRERPVNAAAGLDRKQLVAAPDADVQPVR